MIIKEEIKMENKHLKENRIVEMRALEDTNQMTLEGYAVVFDSFSFVSFLLCIFY